MEDQNKDIKQITKEDFIKLTQRANAGKKYDDLIRDTNEQTKTILKYFKSQTGKDYQNIDELVKDINTDTKLESLKKEGINLDDPKIQKVFNNLIEDKEALEQENQMTKTVWLNNLPRAVCNALSLDHNNKGVLNSIRGIIDDLKLYMKERSFLQESFVESVVIPLIKGRFSPDDLAEARISNIPENKIQIINKEEGAKKDAKDLSKPQETTPDILTKSQMIQQKQRKGQPLTNQEQLFIRNELMYNQAIIDSAKMNISNPNITFKLVKSRAISIIGADVFDQSFELYNATKTQLDKMGIEYK